MTITTHKNYIVLFSISSLGNTKEATRITILSLAQELINRGENVVVVCAKRKSLPKEEKIGEVHLYRYSFPFLSKLFFPLVAVLNLKKKNVQPIIIHGFSSTPLFILSTTLAKAACPKAKIMHTLRSYSRRKWGNIGFFLLNIASKIIIPHQTFVKKLKIISKEKIKVISSSIDQGKFFPQDKEQFKKKYGYENKKVILHYGAMWHNKGTHVLLRAVQQIVAENNKVRILLAPRYSNIQNLHNLVEKLNIKNYVEFIMGDVKIEEYVNLADVVVLPYLNMEGTEGNPSCLLEAMATKTKVVTTDLPELREIAENIAYFAKTGDHTSLRKNILIAFEDTSSEKVERGYSATKNFSVKRSTDEHFSIYEKLISPVNSNSIYKYLPRLSRKNLSKTNKMNMRKIFSLTLDGVFFPVALTLFVIKTLFKVQLYRVNSSRIGHLAVNQDLLLRRMKLGLIKDMNLRYVGVAAKDICNKKLLGLFQRKMRIIQIPQSKRFRAATKYLATKSVFKKIGVFTSLPNDNNEYYEYAVAPPQLSFSEKEENEGKELLQKIGVSKWFVCFHARDKVHINLFLRKGDYRHQFRNTEINNYLGAAKYIAEEGGFALRMGKTVAQELPPQKNDQIIDYATNFRTELGDIYLIAKCKFFLGDSTGLMCVGYIFNTPIAMANVIPLKFQPYTSKYDLFIPKKIWSKKEKRFITFPEIINSPIFHYYHQKEYDDAELIAISNSSEEILELAKEMNQRLDGTWKSTREDEELQQEFKKLFPAGNFCYGFPSRIGAAFLRENRFLLGVNTTA